MNLQADALREYLARFDIPLADSAAPDTSIGLRISADFFAGCPVMSVLEHGRELAREYINPLIGLRDYQARGLGNTANLPQEVWDDFIRLAGKAYRCYIDADALTLDIDPLTIHDGRLAVVTCAMNVDENALYRQHHFLADLTTESLTARRAREAGLHYIPLKGQIGVVANGAGLTLTAMDVIAHYSEERLHAASFLDMGNTLHVDRIGLALELTLSKPDLRAVLVTLFAKHHCAEAAFALINGLPRTAPPVVVFLSGTDGEHARAVIEGVAHPALLVAGSLREAARRVIHAAGEN
ncbi:MAG: hypothetical protein IAE80_18990 [Anaerolinea sp.]|nr:hypothetical protein [Anaerolinea sp.]